MSITLKRTVEHQYDDGSEAVLLVNILSFDDGDKAITIAEEMGGESIMVRGPEHAKRLAAAIQSVASEIWEQFQ